MPAQSLLSISTIIVTFLILTGCNPIPSSTYSSVTTDEEEGLHTVANIGNLTITEREFFTSYEMAPAFLKRKNQGNVRFQHLEFMIFEKLMALEGLARGIDKSKGISLLLSEIQADLAVTEWYSNVFQNVEIDHADLERAIDAYTIRVDYDYLMADSRVELEKVLSELNDDVSFDNLSIPGHFSDSADPPRFWEIQQKEPAFAQIISNLNLGEVSEIIPVKNGFVLVRINGVSRDPFITPGKYSDIARKLEKELLQLRIDSLAYTYISKEMEANEPVIKVEAFSRVVDFFGILSQADTRDTKKLFAGVWPGSLDRSSIEGNISDRLIESEEINLSIRDFLDWYDLRRFEIKGKLQGIKQVGSKALCGGCIEIAYWDSGPKKPVSWIAPGFKMNWGGGERNWYIGK